MGIVNQILLVVQSAAIPLLAVIMALIVFNMMKKPGKTTAVNEDDFKVTESSFWLVIALFWNCGCGDFCLAGIDEYNRRSGCHGLCAGGRLCDRIDHNMLCLF